MLTSLWREQIQEHRLQKQPLRGMEPGAGREEKKIIGTKVRYHLAKKKKKKSETMLERAEKV